MVFPHSDTPLPGWLSPTLSRSVESEMVTSNLSNSSYEMTCCIFSLLWYVLAFPENM